MDKMKKCAPVEKEKESICVFLVRPLTLKVSIEPSIPLLCRCFKCTFFMLIKGKTESLLLLDCRIVSFSHLFFFFLMNEKY